MGQPITKWPAGGPRFVERYYTAGFGFPRVRDGARSGVGARPGGRGRTSCGGDLCRLGSVTARYDRRPLSRSTVNRTSCMSIQYRTGSCLQFPWSRYKSGEPVFSAGTPSSHPTQNVPPTFTDRFNVYNITYKNKNGLQFTGPDKQYHQSFSAIRRFSCLRLDREQNI